MSYLVTVKCYCLLLDICANVYTKWPWINITFWFVLWSRLWCLENDVKWFWSRCCVGFDHSWMRNINLLQHIRIHMTGIGAYNLLKNWRILRAYIWCHVSSCTNSAWCVYGIKVTTPYKAHLNAPVIKFSSFVRPTCPRITWPS